jgi:hypothetical protein
MKNNISDVFETIFFSDIMKAATDNNKPVWQAVAWMLEI